MCERKSRGGWGRCQGGERGEVRGERWDDQSDEFSGEAAALI